MNNMTFTGTMFGERVTLQQISKPAARKLFADGVEVFIQSSNLHPFGMWSTAHGMKYNPDEPDTALEQFNVICNSFSYYNCTSETGRYIHFYKSVLTSPTKGAKIAI